MEENTKPMIYGKMIEAIKKVEHVAKTRQNTQPGASFMFRGIDDVMNALHQVFGEVGIVCVPINTATTQTQRPSKSGGILMCTSMQVNYRFYAEDGSYIDAMMDGEAMDSGDKSTSKAASIAYKYLLLETFMIPTEEQKDPDFETHEVAAKAPVRPQQAPAALKLIPLNIGDVNYAGCVTYLATTQGAKISDLQKKYTLTEAVIEQIQIDTLNYTN